VYQPVGYSPQVLVVGREGIWSISIEHIRKLGAERIGICLHAETSATPGTSEEITCPRESPHIRKSLVCLLEKGHCMKTKISDMVGRFRHINNRVKTSHR